METLNKVTSNDSFSSTVSSKFHSNMEYPFFFTISTTKAVAFYFYTLNIAFEKCCILGLENKSISTSNCQYEHSLSPEPKSNCVFFNVLCSVQVGGKNIESVYISKLMQAKINFFVDHPKECLMKVQIAVINFMIFLLEYLDVIYLKKPYTHRLLALSSIFSN